MANLVQLLKKVNGSSILKKLKIDQILDLTRLESAISAIICGILAMIFGAIAILTSLSILAGVSAGVGVWALIYGLMAFFKKDKND